MIIVPPLKCQGIKTKLVPVIQECVPKDISGRWIEPFCGSGVVALNVQPERALLADKNRHLIQLYQHIQQGQITPGKVRHYLEQGGEQLRQGGQEYYNEVRARFNAKGGSLDFLFLNRACFNGVMRFNSKGGFNVPFGHKPERFRPAYITKIVNQVRKFQILATRFDWQFEVADFRATLSQASKDDFLYVDPPYSGRHTDYYTTWNEADEADLVSTLQSNPTHFLLSTWHHNQYRANPTIDHDWQAYSIRLIKHFYHVGSSESHRGEMVEALIGNYPLPEQIDLPPATTQLALFGDQ